jgi:hypothetical protein
METADSLHRYLSDEYGPIRIFVLISGVWYEIVRIVGGHPQYTFHLLYEGNEYTGLVNDDEPFMVYEEFAQSGYYVICVTML